MPAKRSTRKPRNCHSDRTGMRRRSGWLHAKPCVGFAIVSNKNVKRGAHRKDRATLRLFGPLLFVYCRSSPPASSGVTTAAVSGEGPDQHIETPTPPASTPDGIASALPRQCDEADDARQSADRSAAANRPLIIPPARPWKAFQRSPQALLLPRRQAARPARRLVAAA